MLANKNQQIVRRNLAEPLWIKALLFTAAFFYIGVFLLLPMLIVFANAFSKGILFYFAALVEPNALAALRLTLLTAAIAVPLNTIFGLTAAWSIGKFSFPGRNLLITLLDIPFAVSPVIAGLIYVLLFGLRGWLGPVLDAFNIKIIFVY